MDNTTNQIYFDRSTHRVVVAGKKNVNLQPNYDTDSLTLPESTTSPISPRASFSPESSSCTSPVYSTNYMSDSEYSPFIEDQVEFDPVYSPTMAMYYQQQSQPATVSLDTYEQLLNKYEQVNPDYEKEIQAALLDQWTGRSSHLYPNECADGIELPPVVPFNGDPSLLLMDKFRSAELNKPASPMTPQKSIFASDVEYRKEQNTEVCFDCESGEEEESGYDAESTDSESSNEGDSWYDDESEQSRVFSESEDEAELFPPLPDSVDILFDHFAANFPVLKSAFGETDTPLSEFASDSDMDSDFNDEPLEKVRPQLDAELKKDEETTEPEDDGYNSGAKERPGKRKTTLLNYDDGNDYQPGPSTKRQRVAPKSVGKKQPKKSSVCIERREKRKAPMLGYGGDEDDEEEEREESDGDDGHQPGPSTKRQKVTPKPAQKKAPTTSRGTGNDTKPYKCTYPNCSYSSNRRYNLTTHMKTHNADRVREFPCTQPGCTKAFDRKHDRDRHVETVHKGARPYKCTKCTAQFSRADALAKHIEKHVEEGNA